MYQFSNTLLHVSSVPFNILSSMRECFIVEIQERNVCGQKYRMHIPHVLAQIRIASKHSSTQQTIEFVVFLFYMRIQVIRFLERFQTVLANVRFSCVYH